MIYWLSHTCVNWIFQVTGISDFTARPIDWMLYPSSWLTDYDSGGTGYTVYLTNCHACNLKVSGVTTVTTFGGMTYWNSLEIPILLADWRTDGLTDWLQYFVLIPVQPFRSGTFQSNQWVQCDQTPCHLAYAYTRTVRCFPDFRAHLLSGLSEWLFRSSQNAHAVRLTRPPPCSYQDGCAYHIPISPSFLPLF